MKWWARTRRRADAPLRRLDALRAAAGWTLCGVVPARRYDALVSPGFRSAELLPDARSAVVLGSGGRALWDAARCAPESESDDPLDRMAERVAGEAAAALAGAEAGSASILAHVPRDGVFADFVALGRAAGLGVPGRLSVLLHPEYGPWISLRAAILSTLDLPPDAPLDAFDPCSGCPAPCETACPASAVSMQGLDVGRCAAERARRPACGLRCDARRACVLGPDHAYAPAAEAHHMTFSLIPPEPPDAA